MRLFESLVNELKPEDSLFLFYAGHGSIDPLTNIGSWILQDGTSDRYSPQGKLDNPSIRNILRRLKSRHVLLVSDSCFSGDILNMERGSQITIDDEYFKKAYARRSRQVLTSGASETVPDESAFTRALVRLLEENTRPYVDPLMLFNDIRLTKDLTTSPLLGTLKETDSQEGGSYIFFLKQAQPKFRIVYHPNGATGGAPPTDRNEYEAGSLALLQAPGSLFRAGYEFAGWNTQPDGSGTQYGAGTSIPIPESDITLYARWVPEITFKVIYDPNGATKGSVPIDARSYKPGSAAYVLGPGSLEK
ncbi:MAG: InlB B-repeat-containing protein, partial [Rectinema sp.]|nr:InlB B-repeat-containing protein [Rectinema sp.]